MISLDELMISWFERNGAKQYLHNKLIKFGYKMWVVATCDGYYIQYDSYLGAGTDLDPDLALYGNVADSLVSILSLQKDS